MSLGLVATTRLEWSRPAGIIRPRGNTAQVVNGTRSEGTVMTYTNKPPQPADPPVDHRGLQRLGFDECLDRLREAKVGRVAFASDGEIVVLPVNPFLDNTTIMFRTSWGSKLLAADRANRVAFEVDFFDPHSATGWSVLVQGTLGVVDSTAECARLELIAPPAWLAESGDSFWVSIRPHDISGRQLTPDVLVRSRTG